MAREMPRIAGQCGSVSHVAYLMRDPGAAARSQAEHVPLDSGPRGKGWSDHGNESDRHSSARPTHQASTVQSANDASSPPSTLDETEIKRIFGEALAAQPAGPARFILYFKDDSEELTPESEMLLSEVFRNIRARDALDISVIGHTDAIGTRDYNYQLSLRRARKVADPSRGGERGHIFC